MLASGSSVSAAAAAAAAAVAAAFAWGTRTCNVDGQCRCNMYSCTREIWKLARKNGLERNAQVITCNALTSNSVSAAITDGR